MLIIVIGQNWKPSDLKFQLLLFKMESEDNSHIALPKYNEVIRFNKTEHLVQKSKKRTSRQASSYLTGITQCLVCDLLGRTIASAHSQQSRDNEQKLKIFPQHVFKMFRDHPVYSFLLEDDEILAMEKVANKNGKFQPNISSLRL